MNNKQTNTSDKGRLINVKIKGRVKPYVRPVPLPIINMPHWVEGDLFNVIVEGTVCGN